MNDEMVLKIAEETSINFDGDASSNEWLIDFAHRLDAANRLKTELADANEKLARLLELAKLVAITAGEDDSLWPEMKDLRAELEKE